MCLRSPPLCTEIKCLCLSESRPCPLSNVAEENRPDFFGHGPRWAMPGFNCQQGAHLQREPSVLQKSGSFAPCGKNRLCFAPQRLHREKGHRASREKATRNGTCSSLCDFRDRCNHPPGCDYKPQVSLELLKIMICTSHVQRSLKHLTRRR